MTINLFAGELWAEGKNLPFKFSKMSAHSSLLGCKYSSVYSRLFLLG